MLFDGALTVRGWWVVEFGINSYLGPAEMASFSSRDEIQYFNVQASNLVVTDRYKISPHFVLLALLVLNSFQAWKHKMNSTVNNVEFVEISPIIVLLRHRINRYISAKAVREKLKTAEIAMVILPEFSKNATKLTMLIISQSACYV